MRFRLTETIAENHVNGIYAIYIAIILIPFTRIFINDLINMNISDFVLNFIAVSIFLIISYFIADFTVDYSLQYLTNYYIRTYIKLSNLNMFFNNPTKVYKEIDRDIAILFVIALRQFYKYSLVIVYIIAIATILGYLKLINIIITLIITVCTTVYVLKKRKKLLKYFELI